MEKRRAGKKHVHTVECETCEYLFKQRSIMLLLLLTLTSSNLSIDLDYHVLFLETWLSF